VHFPSTVFFGGSDATNEASYAETDVQFIISLCRIGVNEVSPHIDHNIESNRKNFPQPKPVRQAQRLPPMRGPGDSVEKMESVYGTGHVRKAEDMPAYRYENDGRYHLIFFHDGGQIAGWHLSIYPSIIND